MNKVILGVLAALALSASAGAASAQTSWPACFRGDTMDVSGDHTGALGAPKCDSSHDSQSANASRSANDAYGEYYGSRAR